MKRLIYISLLFVFLAACVPVPANTPAPATAAPTAIPPTQPAPAEPPQPWWRDAVFYEIFVRSFNDSNGDGIGDFNGITQKLDYLKTLGITAIWLMPIHPSPSYHGYDVLNFYAVNPQYGSLADFKQLLGAAHAKNIRIIIDLVLNHTSAQHPIFLDAKSNSQSKYRDWYVWSDTNPGSRWVQAGEAYYYAYFWEGMPDLNYRNPEVTLQMEKMSAFWLNSVGVDGFRIDAAKHLIEEGDKLENTPATHAWLQNYYTFYKAENRDAYVVGEVAGAGGSIAKTYENQMDQIFNFELANAFVNSSSGGSSSSVVSSYKFALKEKPDGNYATFLTNHDQNRIMSVLNGDENKAKVAASLLLTGPGTPFIYYGEEIGMQGKKPDEDIRLPMQWTSDLATSGFTSGQPWRNPGLNTSSMNVTVEIGNSNSLYNHYRALIALRLQYHALRTGSVTLLETNNPGVFASLRKQGPETILVLINLTSKPISAYKLTLSDSILTDGQYSPSVILGPKDDLAELQVNTGKFSAYQPLPELPPFSTILALIK
ncbi:MAG: alpha-amylase family glycosyl hydrolase [Chloroflexota bacterium]